MGSPSKDIAYPGLGDELDCAICKTALTDPRVLNCQHTFCLRCLFTIVGKSKEKRLIVKCPFCGEGATTVLKGDIRSLKRNTVLTSISHLYRKGRWADAAKRGEAITCDECAAEEDVDICSRCCGFLCKSCISGEHTFLCSRDGPPAERPRLLHPFFWGWNVAERRLLSRIRVSHGLRNVRITDVSKVWAPYSLETVVGTVLVGPAKTKTEGLVPVFTSGALGSFRQEIEEDCRPPTASKELSDLCRMQEVKGRQIDILRSLRVLLKHPQLRVHLRQHAGQVRDGLLWDCGLSADVACLVELLLSLRRIVVAPVERQLILLSSLEGMESSAQASAALRTQETRAAQELGRIQLLRQLQIASDIRDQLQAMSEEETQLVAEAQRAVSELQQQQRRAWRSWQGVVGIVGVPLESLALDGRAELHPRRSPPLRVEHAVTGDLTQPGKWSLRGLSGGAVTFTHSARQDGQHALSVFYVGSEPHGTALQATVVGKRAARPSVCGRKSGLVVFRLSLTRGSNIIRLTGVRGRPAPEVLRITVSPVRSGASGSDLPDIRSGPLASLHREVLVAFALLHQQQLQLCEAVEEIHQSAAKGRSGASERERESQREAAEARVGLLSHMRSLQQMRVHQRQHFYYALAGLLPADADAPPPDASEALHSYKTQSASKISAVSEPFPTALFPPFPIIAPPPLGSPSCYSVRGPKDDVLPNVLAQLQPRINELRDEQQRLLLQEPGGVTGGAMQGQLQGLLDTSLELVQREYVLMLRESCQAAAESLLLHMQAGGVPRLLDFFSDPAAKRHARGVQVRGDVEDLAAITELWGGLIAKWTHSTEEHGEGAAPDRVDMAAQADL
eukprot:Hpha_TRINITY_DN10804_c0_g1::TRINITY_DN10804_c0_g1_i1::g.23371::m.23371